MTQRGLNWKHLLATGVVSALLPFGGMLWRAAQYADRVTNLETSLAEAKATIINLDARVDDMRERLAIVEATLHRR